jgi:TolB-like protein
VADFHLFRELKRRNVLRAAVLYAGAVWALSQGISQLTPAIGLPDWATRWFLIACIIGFPLWIAFAWVYELTPSGLKRESEIGPADSIAHYTGRKLDFWIIGVLTVAVVLLLTNQFMWHKGAEPNAAVLAAKIPAKSIAVLPFENLSDDKKNEYFVAGMQDLILTKLADIGDLKVIARTSTMRYGSHPEDLKTIGRQLGVATVLEGSVQKQGNRVLIDVQLIDTRTDGHIWAQAYPRNLSDIFGVEGEVAEKIASALKTKLSPAESVRVASVPTTNPAAYDLFLRAEYMAHLGDVNYDTASLRTAIPLYRQAVEKDSGFALGWARLSWVESALAWFGGGSLNVEQLTIQARADAERALALAPNQPASQIALGYSDYYGRLDYAGALKSFAAALALRPNDATALAATGYVLRRQTRFDAAIASLQQALAHDPRNSELAFELGATCMQANRYPDAEAWFRRALALDPDNLNAKVGYSDAILFTSSNISRALAAAAGDAPALKLQRVTLLTYQRQYQKAAGLLDGIPDKPGNFQPGRGVSKALLQANLFRLMGDGIRARPLFTQALAAARPQLEVQQGILLSQVWQKIADAELGLDHTVQALNALAKAQAIIARTWDKGFSPAHMEVSASLYAEAQRPDLAVPLLAKALASPGIGNSYSPVLLWFDPAWDPIRYDPRFRALLEKYARYKPVAIPASPAASTAPAGSVAGSIP